MTIHLPFCLHQAPPQSAVSDTEPITETPMAEFQVTIKTFDQTIDRSV